MPTYTAKLDELAKLVGGVVEGNPDTIITGVAVVEDAENGDIVIADREPYFTKSLKSPAACTLTGKDCIAATDKNLLRVENPQEAFMTLLSLYGGEESLPAPGISDTAVIEDGADVAEDASIGPNCYIGSGAVIGSGTILYPNVYVGENVTVGENSRLYPGVTIYKDCSIGSRAIIHAGVVIGADGFGFRMCPELGLIKYPHIGTVEIGDDVEIGANSTIDRSKTGKTVIGRGTKIDNLVHIAHNVKIGCNCVVVAQTGVAGSVRVGDGVTLAAQAGVKDHISIGDGAVIAAKSGVMGNIAAGSVVSGFPARDHRFNMRAEAARLHLPELIQRVKTLEKELETLKGVLNSGMEDDVK